MNGFLVSVVSGLVATALFELIRSRELRDRIGSIVSRPASAKVAGRIDPIWLIVRVLVTIAMAFFGGAFLAAIVEVLGHSTIELTQPAGILLAAIAALAGWTSSRTGRRLARATLSILAAVAITLFAFAPIARSLGWGLEPAAPVAILVIVFLLCWELMALIPVLRPSETHR